MTSLDSILVVTDFSDSATNAVRRAALIAAQHQARLTLLHVVDPAVCSGPRTWFKSSAGIDHKVAVAQAALGRLAARMVDRHGVQVTQSVMVGGALEHVCGLTERADLLVIGTRRVNPLRSLILGTPAEQLMRLARRPVLFVSQAADEHYRRPLVAMDLDVLAESTLRNASALAPAASLHVFHALNTRRMDRMRASDVPATVIREVGDGELQRGEARLRYILASLGLTDAQVSVAHGDPPRLALERQQELVADLIVLGKDGPSSLCNFLLGSVARRVLSSATCDVLVVPKVVLPSDDVLAAREPWVDRGPRMACAQIAVSPRTGNEATHHRFGSHDFGSQVPGSRDLSRDQLEGAAPVA